MEEQKKIEELNEKIIHYLVDPKKYELPKGVKFLHIDKPKMSVKHSLADVIKDEKPIPEKELRTKDGYAIALPTVYVGFYYDGKPRVISTEYKWFIFENKEQGAVAKKRSRDAVVNMAYKVLKEAESKGGDNK